jgi:hypothetical protein
MQGNSFGHLLGTPSAPQQQPPRGVVLPAPPVDPAKAPQVRNVTADAVVAEGTAPTTIQTNQAPAGYMWVNPSNPREGVVPIPGFTPQNTNAPEPMKLTQFRALEDQIARVEQLYRQGPGATTGIRSLADYVPEAFSDTNAAFNSAAAGLGEVGLAAFRVPGVGSQSDAELRQFVAANTPSASDNDAKIAEKIGNLRRRLKATQEGLGIAPAANNTNALGQIRTNGGQFSGTNTAAPLADATAENYRNVNDPVFSRSHDDLVRTLIAEGGGRLDPDKYAVALGKLTNEFGYNDPSGPDGRRAWAQEVNKYLDSGGRTIPTDLTVRDLMSMNETAANNLINNPFVAAPIGFANMLTGGIPEALAPGQFAALRDSQAIPIAIGEVGGAVVGTNAIGAIGRNTIGKAVPSLLGQQGVSAGSGIGNFARSIAQGRAQTAGQFGRNLAADATYGGIYGGVTEGDPINGAAFATAASGTGQLLGRGFGAGIGGMERTAAAQALMDQGVPVSVGRQVGLGRVEDILSSLPFANEAVRNRQLDSFVGFNKGAFDIAAEPASRLTTPVPVPSGGYGRGGIDALQGAERQAYGNTLNGVTVGIDPAFTTDFAAAARQIGNLPGDYQNAARDVVAGRVGPAITNGQMTGPNYQQAIRGIRNAKSGAKGVGTSGFEDSYVTALNSVEDALTGVVQRNAGQGVIDDLALSNNLYSNRKILENASLDRAKVGTRSGEVNVFTPSQLLESTRQAEVRYGTGEDLRKFAEAGQEVLPSTVPNSGTADRLIALGVLTGAGGAGGAVNFDANIGPQSAVDGGQNWAQNTLAAGTILGLLGTRRGQKTLEQLLINRPQAAQNIGQGVRRRTGLFGSTGAALALPYLPNQ